MNSDICSKYFYFHKKHILKIKMHMKNFCKYIMGAGRSPANYGFGHLPDFEAFLCLQDEKDVYEACFMSTESNKLVF